jgi:flagellin-like protein
MIGAEESHMRRRFSSNQGRGGSFYRKAVLNERGVTGLKTAIILIAFVVAASVFAFTVLSTGIFSAERGKETVFAGLEETQGTLEPKGRVTANGLTKKTLSLGDVAWTAGSASTTVSLDTTDKKVGTGSADLLVLGSMTTGLSAYENLAIPTDLSDLTQISFWAKSSTTTIAGEIEVVLDESKGCASPESHIDLPAMTADAWQLVTAAITQSDGSTAVANSNKDGVNCVGIEVETDLSCSATNVTLNFDRIEAVGIVTSVEVTVTNAVEGEPVDLREPGDSDANGIADSDSEHTLVMTYADKNQLVRDLYWTRTFRGENDSDDLLEAGETVELTIYLTGLADATPLVKNLEFNLEMKPAIGAVIKMRRTTPAVIDTVMVLN